MHIFVASLCQLGLCHEVVEGMAVLHLRYPDDRTSNRQHVGTHVGKCPCHIVEFVVVFQLIPFIRAIGQEIVVVLAFVMLDVKKILKVVEPNAIDSIFLLCRHIGHENHHGDKYHYKFFHIIEV